MRTNLNRKITSIEDAKAYLSDLQSNNEAYHPDDSADSVEWAVNAPDANECIKLDSLMDACRDFLDPCEELLALGHKDKEFTMTRDGKGTFNVSGYSLYLSDIKGEAFGEYMNIGEVGDVFESEQIKITRTK